MYRITQRKFHRYDADASAFHQFRLQPFKRPLRRTRVARTTAAQLIKSKPGLKYEHAKQVGAHRGETRPFQSPANPTLVISALCEKKNRNGPGVERGALNRSITLNDIRGSHNGTR